MKMIRLFATTVALVVGFTAGFYAVGKMTKREDPELRRLRESVERSAPLERQYREGDYARAKEALQSLISHYDRMDAESAGRANPYAADAVACYARLSVLEQKNGGAGAAEMGEAVRRCERLRELGGRPRNCSEEHLRAEVARADAMPLHQLND